MCTVSHVYPHVPVEEHWHAYVLGHDQADVMHSSSSQMFTMRNGEILLVSERLNSQREA